MGIHDIARTQQTGESASHRRMLEHLLDLWDAGENVIAGVAFVGEHRLQLVVDDPVYGIPGAGLHENVPVADELLDLSVRQQVLVDSHAPP